MEWLSQQEYETAFESETAAFVAAAARHDPAAMVPTCPDWTYRQLIGHVGTGHRYACGLISRGADSPQPYERIEPPAQWQQWLTDGAAELIAAVRAYGFAEPVWNWQPADPRAGVWLRRMLHDEIIHRFDADPAGELAPELAADGIQDLLVVISTLAGTSMALTGTGETLRLRTPEGTWLATVHPEGVSWQEGDGPAGETLTGSSLEVLLVLNRRRPPAEPGPLLTGWLASTRF
jgi:uncharacterized protein (TIGR03083 family)